MPEDKKNRQKGKSDAKEQRKPRQERQKSGPAKIAVPLHVETKTEEPKVPQTPAYEDPGPEFYKNLKRETDEILKITEEANSKYKKKEIQSNWSKYEMPIESYEDIEEQENMGADYEQLVQMPPSVGGHFQFKHEKSWDVSTGPSPYDKYFDINMNNVANALCTIPFYERNNIEKDIFSESDILTMNNRAVKYKQKYYNDKSFTTPELEARDKLLKEAFSKTEPDDTSKTVDSIEEKEDIVDESPVVFSVKETDKFELTLQNRIVENMNSESDIGDGVSSSRQVSETQRVAEIIDDIDDLILEDIDITPAQAKVEIALSGKVQKCEVMPAICVNKPMEKDDKFKSVKPEQKKPVIESPEDLEKWLDDFLDG